MDLIKCESCGMEIKKGTNAYELDGSILCEKCYQKDVGDEKVFSASHGWLSYEDIEEGFEYDSETENRAKKIVI